MKTLHELGKAAALAQNAEAGRSGEVAGTAGHKQRSVAMTGVFPSC